MNKQQQTELKTESEKLYKVALSLDNQLAEVKKVSFTQAEFVQSVKSNNSLMLLNQLIAYGFITPVFQGQYKIVYTPNARKENIGRNIAAIENEIKKLRDQKAKLQELIKVI